MSSYTNIENNLASLLTKAYQASRTSSENLPTLSHCVEICLKLYGEKKVAEVFHRYGRDLNAEKNSVTPIAKKTIKELLVGFNDITSHDIQDFYLSIKAGSFIPARQQDAFQSLDNNLRQELLESKAINASQLPPHLFNALLNALKKPSDQYSSLTINPIETSKVSCLPKKYWEHGVKSFRAGRNSEDRDRISLYEELSQLNSTQESRYCELLSKILVKKNMFIEESKSSKLLSGILLPAIKGPNGEERWYRVGEIMDAGLGKFAYRLVPATTEYGEDMPDILLYRSTSSLPTTIDSFGSILNDINPFETPGYLSKKRKAKTERCWFSQSSPMPEEKTGSRPLLVTGHSLGGAIAQVGLLNVQKKAAKNKSVWPDRPITAHLFDSPAVEKSDALAFKDWVSKKQDEIKPLSLNYYISAEDVIPYGGLNYLGNGFEREGKINAKVSFMELTKKGESNQNINIIGLPPLPWKKKGENKIECGPHCRIWQRGKEGSDSDYIVSKYSVKDYDTFVEKRRVLLNKVIKYVAWFFLFPLCAPIFTAVLLKRIFIGRYGHDPLIKSACRKAFRHLQQAFHKIRLQTNYKKK